MNRMSTFADAQTWITVVSLVASAALLGFFLLAPQLNYPLDTPQARHLVQLVVPPFLGYLAAAVRFVVGSPVKASILAARRLPPLFPLLLLGTTALYFAVLIFSTTSFYIANAPSLAYRHTTPMSFDDLSWAICGALSVQAATMGLLTAYVFGQETSAVSLGGKVKK